MEKIASISEAVEGLKLVKQGLFDLLDKDHHQLGISVGTAMDRIIALLNFSNGIVETGTPAGKFAPITEFMGEPIHTAEPVKEEDFTPEEEEKAAFVGKVDNLEKDIAALDNKKILETYATNEDRLVIRGVAKRAGLEDFREAELTEAYLDVIKKGLLLKQAQKAFEDKTNEGLDKQ